MPIGKGFALSIRGIAVLSLAALGTTLTFAQATTKAAQATPAPPVAPKAPLTEKVGRKIVEIGILDGAEYRIDVPEDWNHNLVVFYHGYSESPNHYKADAPINTQARPMLDRGFAVIQSAYSQTGWALAVAFPETEKLRKYFVKKFGQPKETYVAGGSMGGALTMVTIERNPKVYNGALDLCGAVGPTAVHVNRRFAWRAAFDYYFPGVMPPLNPVPANFIETEALRQKALIALNAKPAAAESMRDITGLHTNIEVARMMVYFTFFIGDMQRKAGGNPFDNRNTIYTGSSVDTHTDYALNDGVRRYAADPKALRYLLDNYTPTGKVTKPMLALHTVYDPLIPANTLTLYAQIIEQAGYSHNFVQTYVHREGHCTMSSEEVGKAFDELLTWVHGGHPPQAGLQR
jgi:pimeloyl-ACP methyl ester carboxylesterase